MHSKKSLFTIILLVVTVLVWGQKKDDQPSFWDKAVGEGQKKFVDGTISGLDKIIDFGNDVKEYDKTNIAFENYAKTSNYQTYNESKSMLLYEKGQYRKMEQSGAGSGALKNQQNKVDDLFKKNNQAKGNILKSDQSIAHSQNRIKQIDGVEKTLTPLKKVAKAGKFIMDKKDAAGAAGTVAGEFSMWWEGKSSFKNVVLSTAKTGGKIVATGAFATAAGTIGTFLSGGNPVVGGGVGIYAGMKAEEFFDKVIGKSLDRAMQYEHDRMNQYRVDPEKLFQMRMKKQEEAWQKQKKGMEDQLANIDENLAAIENHLLAQKQAWEAFEAESKQAAKAEENRLAKETPRISYNVPKGVEPGKTISIEVKVNGGLRPVTLSGAIDGKLDRGENSFTFQYTVPKDMEPGDYNFGITATSASGLSSSTSIPVEVKSNETEEEIVETASDLNVNTGNLKLKRKCSITIQTADTKLVYTLDPSAEESEDLITWNGSRFKGLYHSIYFTNSSDDMGMGGLLPDGMGQITDKFEGTVNEEFTLIETISGSSIDEGAANEDGSSQMKTLSRFTIRNVPIYSTNGGKIVYQVNSTGIGASLVSFSFQRDGKLVSSRSFDNNSYIKIEFW